MLFYLFYSFYVILFISFFSLIFLSKIYFLPDSNKVSLRYLDLQYTCIIHLGQERFYYY